METQETIEALAEMAGLETFLRGMETKRDLLKVRENILP